MRTGGVVKKNLLFFLVLLDFATVQLRSVRLDGEGEVHNGRWDRILAILSGF